MFVQTASVLAQAENQGCFTALPFQTSLAVAATLTASGQCPRRCSMVVNFVPADPRSRIALETHVKEWHRHVLVRDEYQKPGPGQFFRKEDKEIYNESYLFLYTYNRILQCFYTCIYSCRYIYIYIYIQGPNRLRRVYSALYPRNLRVYTTASGEFIIIVTTNRLRRVSTQQDNEKQPQAIVFS